MVSVRRLFVMSILLAVAMVAHSLPAAAVLPLCHPLSKGGKQQAMTALSYYNQGRYTQAYFRFRQLAEGGNPYAQNQLAIMYNRGLGVARNYPAAVDWWRKAAEQGQVTAQCNLGIMYMYGQGVKQDDVMAYVLFNVAAARGSMDARRRRDMLEAWRLTYTELRKAQKLSDEWAANNSK